MNDISDDMEEMQRDLKTFEDRFAENGKGWDDDGDGQVSSAEALGMISDLGSVPDDTDVVITQYGKLSQTSSSGSSSTGSRRVSCSLMESTVRLVFKRKSIKRYFSCSNFDEDGDGYLDADEIASSIDARNLISGSDAKALWQDAIKSGNRIVSKTKSWTNTFKNSLSKVTKLLKKKSKFSPSKVRCKSRHYH